MSASASQTITRRSASNLALGFLLLPKAKRRAMAALYAFCREVDDIADEAALPTEQRRAELARWRADVRAACGDGSPRIAVNRELQPIIHQHHLPFEYFNELIRGVEMDLDYQRYPSIADLDLYCYRVASVVGLLSIEVFGYRNPACRAYAVSLGKALQLTNILRDVRTDADRGRIYLPLEELQRFGVAENEILHRQYSARYRELAATLAQRARSFYQVARETLPAEDRRAMIAAELMGTVYWRLLGQLERAGFDVFGPVAPRVGKVRKGLLILRTWWRFRLGSPAPGYGLC